MGDLYKDSDNLLEIEGLRNQADGTYLNSVSITVTCMDASTLVAISFSDATTWPLTMDYVADSNGNYQLTLPDVMELTLGQTVRIEALADGGADLKRVFVDEVSVIERTQA